MADPKIQIELIDTTTGGTVPGFAGADETGGEQTAKRRTAQRESNTAAAGGVAAEATASAREAKKEKVEDAILLKADPAASKVAENATDKSKDGEIKDAIMLDFGSRAKEAASKVSEIGGIGKQLGIPGAGLLSEAGGIIGKVASAAGPVGAVVAAATAAVAAIGTAVKVVLGAADKKASQLAFASPEIQVARARVEVADIMSRIRQAEALGPTLAGIETAKGGISRDIEEIFSVTMQPLFEMLKDLLEVVQTFTRPLSNFFEEHRDLIAKVIKFFFNIISPMTKVIEWWAEWAGGGNAEEFGDPIAEMLAIVQGQPIDPAWGGRGFEGRGAGGPGDRLAGGLLRGGAIALAPGAAALFGLGMQ